MDIAHGLKELTTRQKQVVKLIVDGQPNAKIADVLGCEINTVKRHVSAVLSKLNVGSRYELRRLLGFRGRPLAAMSALESGRSQEENTS
jgi:DNA-binding NarL/FixJ family response regulator